MHGDVLEILCCPDCRGELTLEGDVEGGTFRCVACDAAYPIVRGVPRFVAAANYASSFGFQWNRFPRTQLDSTSGTSISSDRFFGQSGWNAEELRGRRVLDIGCGAGRFAEVAVRSGARVVAIDSSSAVDACRSNLAGED